MAMQHISKEELLSENVELRHEIADLKSKNIELIRLIQGVKSERFVSADPLKEGGQEGKETQASANV